MVSLSVLLLQLVHQVHSGDAIPLLNLYRVDFDREASGEKLLHCNLHHFESVLRC